MEVELMVTKRDDDQRQPTTDNQQGEYRAICLGKAGRHSYAILTIENNNHNIHSDPSIRRGRGNSGDVFWQDETTLTSVQLDYVHQTSLQCLLSKIC